MTLVQQKIYMSTFTYKVPSSIVTKYFTHLKLLYSLMVTVNTLKKVT